MCVCVRVCVFLISPIGDNYVLLRMHWGRPQLSCEYIVDFQKINNIRMTTGDVPNAFIAEHNCPHLG